MVVVFDSSQLNLASQSTCLSQWRLKPSVELINNQATCRGRCVCLSWPPANKRIKALTPLRIHLSSLPKSYLLLLLWCLTAAQTNEIHRSAEVPAGTCRSCSTFSPRVDTNDCVLTDSACLSIRSLDLCCFSLSFSLLPSLPLSRSLSDLLLFLLRLCWMLVQGAGWRLLQAALLWPHWLCVCCSN